MQVFTTIYLAETAPSDNENGGETIAGYHDKRDLFEIKPINLEKIAMLEACNWFLDDLPSED